MSYHHLGQLRLDNELRGDRRRLSRGESLFWIGTLAFLLAVCLIQLDHLMKAHGNMNFWDLYNEICGPEEISADSGVSN